jgi:hypothetical protein
LAYMKINPKSNMRMNADSPIVTNFAFAKLAPITARRLCGRYVPKDNIEKIDVMEYIH